MSVRLEEGTGDAIAGAIAGVAARHPVPGYCDGKEAEIRAIAEALAEVAPSPARLLDVGCGGMEKPAVFRRLGYECFACDDFQDPWHLQDGNVEKLLAFARDEGIDVHRQDQSYDLPWPPGMADVVTILGVIEHLSVSPRGMMSFAGTYLKSGGVILLVTPNSVNLRKRLSVLLGRTNYPSARSFFDSAGPWRGHVREYTLSELENVVRWSGFEVIHSETYHGMAERRLRSKPLRTVYKGVAGARPTLRDSLLVVGRKPANWSPCDAPTAEASEAASKAAMSW